MFFRISAAAACVAGILSAGAAQAQGTPTFSLELNAAAQTETGSCRLTYVASNLSDIALERTAYQFAIFDGEGVVNRLLVLDFGALVAGKTKILQFDLTGSPCDSISRIVVNDVTACTVAGTGEASDICMGGLAASSRTAIQFGL